MYAYCEVHQLVVSQKDGKQMDSDTVKTCGSELIIIAQNLVKFKYAVKYNRPCFLYAVEDTNGRRGAAANSESRRFCLY